MATTEIEGASTPRLASFASGIEVDSLPEAVVHAAKRAALDHLGVAYLGSRQESSRRLRTALHQLEGVGTALVIGTEQRSNPLHAAMANGFAAHLLDFDDIYNPPESTIHASSALWPAILGAAALVPLSGADALAAFVAGFEVEARVARAAGKGHYEGSWQVSGTAGHIGAAAAAARALSLSPEQTVYALGAAAQQAAGLRGSYGSDAKTLGLAKAAMDGLLSACLAAQGLTAKDDVIEGVGGFLRTTSPDPDLSMLVSGLGTTWLVLDNGHKIYPSASLTHPAIDAVMGLKEQGLVVSDVALLELRVNQFAARAAGVMEPVSPADGRFSLSHCAAVALLGESVNATDFESAKLVDPVVIETRNLVRVVDDVAIAKHQAVAVATLRDGQTIEFTVAANRGTGLDPLSDLELETKFRRSCEPWLGESACQDVVDAVWKLDGCERVDVVAIPLSR